MTRCLALAASIFFAWVTSAGTLAFTDDPARVPSKYTATETSWEELRARTDKRWTVDKTRAE